MTTRITLTGGAALALALLASAPAMTDSMSMDDCGAILATDVRGDDPHIHALARDCAYWGIFGRGDDSRSTEAAQLNCGNAVQIARRRRPDCTSKLSRSPPLLSIQEVSSHVQSPALHRLEPDGRHRRLCLADRRRGLRRLQPGPTELTATQRFKHPSGSGTKSSRIGVVVCQHPRWPARPVRTGLGRGRG